MKYALYAIEEDAPEGPALMERYDERGNGSPLVWTDRKDAEEVVRYAEEHDAPGEQRVVQLTGATDTPRVIEY